MSPQPAEPGDGPDAGAATVTLRVASAALDPALGDVEGNLRAAEAAVRAAAQAGAQLVLLPEMWPTSFVPEVGEAARATSEAAVGAIAALTAEVPVCVVGSAYGPSTPLPTNRAHVLGEGRVLGAYDKVHLFSPTAESLTFSAGSAPPPVVELPGTDVRVAPIVCYDLRFPEVARAAFRRGAEVLAVVAQWPQERAPHLNALIRGRAAELEGFVIASNRSGTDFVGRRRLRLEFDGAEPCAAGPSGSEIEAHETFDLDVPGRSPTRVRVFDIDPTEARALRRSVPIARDDRADLYRGW